MISTYFCFFPGREFNCCVAFQTGHSEKKLWPELNPRIWCLQRGSLRKWPMSVHEFELTRKRFHIPRSGWIIRRSEEATVSSILRFWQILSLYTPENERLEHQSHLMKKGSRNLPNLHFLGFQTSIFQGVPFTHVTNRTSSSKLFPGFTWEKIPMVDLLSREAGVEFGGFFFGSFKGMWEPINHFNDPKCFFQWGNVTISMTILPICWTWLNMNRLNRCDLTIFWSVLMAENRDVRKPLM